jgi:hypothetical protein
MNIFLIIFIVIIFIAIISSLIIKYDHAIKNYPLLIKSPVYLNAQCIGQSGCSNFASYTQKILEQPPKPGYGYSISLFLYLYNRNNSKSSSNSVIVNEEIQYDIFGNPIIKEKSNEMKSKNIISFSNEFEIKYIEKNSTLFFKIFIRNNLEYKEFTLSKILLQKWHHIVLCVDNRDVYIYLDNILQIVETLPYLPEIALNKINLSECDHQSPQLECIENVINCTEDTPGVKTVNKCTDAIDGEISLLQYYNNPINSSVVNKLYNKFINNPTGGLLWWL